MSSGHAGENGKALTIKTAYAIIGVHRKGCIGHGRHDRKRRGRVKEQHAKAQPALNIQRPRKKTF